MAYIQNLYAYVDLGNNPPNVGKFDMQCLGGSSDHTPFDDGCPQVHCHSLVACLKLGLLNILQLVPARTQQHG